MVKLKHVKKAHKHLVKSKPKNVETCNIKYEYTFDRYRSGKYMCPILNIENPVNQPALIMHELKQNKTKENGIIHTHINEDKIDIYIKTNQITVNNESFSVKQLEREIYGYVSKEKHPSTNYKYWILAKYLDKKSNKNIS